MYNCIKTTKDGLVCILYVFPLLQSRNDVFPNWVFSILFYYNLLWCTSKSNHVPPINGALSYSTPWLNNLNILCSYLFLRANQLYPSFRIDFLSKFSFSNFKFGFREMLWWKWSLAKSSSTGNFKPWDVIKMGDLMEEVSVTWLVKSCKC